MQEKCTSHATQGAGGGRAGIGLEIIGAHGVPSLFAGKNAHARHETNKSAKEQGRRESSPSFDAVEFRSPVIRIQGHCGRPVSRKVWRQGVKGLDCREKGKLGRGRRRCGREVLLARCEKGGAEIKAGRKGWELSRRAVI